MGAHFGLGRLIQRSAFGSEFHSSSVHDDELFFSIH